MVISAEEYLRIYQSIIQLLHNTIQEFWRTVSNVYIGIPLYMEKNI